MGQICSQTSLGQWAPMGPAPNWSNARVSIGLMGPNGSQAFCIILAAWMIWHPDPPNHPGLKISPHVIRHRTVLSHTGTWAPNLLAVKYVFDSSYCVHRPRTHAMKSRSRVLYKSHVTGQISAGNHNCISAFEMPLVISWIRQSF